MPTLTFEQLASQVAMLRREHDELRAEVEGPLIGVNRLPIRDRLHELESSNAAQSAAESALAAIRAKDDVREARRYTRHIAIIGLGFTAANVLLQVLWH